MSADPAYQTTEGWTPVATKTSTSPTPGAVASTAPADGAASSTARTTLDGFPVEPIWDELTDNGAAAPEPVRDPTSFEALMIGVGGAFDGGRGVFSAEPGDEQYPPAWYAPDRARRDSEANARRDAAAATRSDAGTSGQETGFAPIVGGVSGDA